MEIIARRVQEGAGLISVLDGPTAPPLVPPGCNPPFQLRQRRLLRSQGDPLVVPGRAMLFETDAG